jgi:hypothetical protein
MKLWALNFILALCLILGSSSSSFAFKLYFDNTFTDYIEAKEQDCEVHETEGGEITLGFKAGNFLFNVGPEVTFGIYEGIDWDVTVQRLIARYQQVCTRYNTGSLTKKDYDNRIVQIETLEKEAHKLYQKMLKEKAQKRDNAFRELDQDVDRFESYQQKYKDIKRQIKDL